MEEFDYIIVGAGSAGCVLANRLSADPNCRVLLLEAGPEDSHPLIRVPMGVGKVLQNPALNWYYMTEPEAGNAFRSRVWLRGKTLGGSSSVNGMMYMRGQPEDYDYWQTLGNPGWGWDEMGRCFREIEDHELGDDGVRGVGGPLHISIQRYRSPLTAAILKTGNALGLECKADINRPAQEGIGYTPVTIRNGRRVSAADAFLKPVRNRRNLVVITGAHVHRVLFRNKQAVAVEGHTAQGLTQWQGREIILSAGALHSPKILQLSGVGSAEHLAGLDIPVVHHSPGVGANMREHKVLTMQLRLRQPYSHNVELRGARALLSALQYALFRRGVMASTYDITAFVRTDPALPRPDAQLTFWSLSMVKGVNEMRLEDKPGMMIMGYPLRTESQGSVMIRSADAEQAPVIRTNFLEAEYDRRVIIGLFRYMRRFTGHADFRKLIDSETFPGAAIESDADILQACREDDTCMHAVGTCRMGQDAEAVVDAALRVKGVSGLRVMDCSVMPTQVSGNTNGPVMAMAWRAAEIILNTKA